MVLLRAWRLLMIGLPLYDHQNVEMYDTVCGAMCEDRVLDGPVSWGKGSKGKNLLDCIWGKAVLYWHSCMLNMLFRKQIGEDFTQKVEM